MSKRYHHFLRNTLLTGGLCIAVTMLRAQDTNMVRQAETVHKTGKKPLLKNDSAFTFKQAENKNDTIQDKVPPAENIPAKSKDTGVKKTATPSRTPPSTVSAEARVIGKASQHADTALQERENSRPRVKAPAAVLVLPSFAGKSFHHYNAFINYLLADNAIFKNTAHPLPDVATLRNSPMPDTAAGIFYIMTGVLFFLAIIRLSFTKYFSDLFRAFFSPTLSQRQLRDQLSQTPFPAFLLNIFFGLSAGLYLFLILRHFHFITTSRPLFLIPVFMLLILFIYLFKYLFLRFSGWLLGYHEAASGYVFTLYMINKVTGIILLPFVLILAFSTPAIASVALNISLIIVLVLFVYRYIRIYALVKDQIFLNKFHFFIYLCGFEIAPVLIIGKLVLIWLNGA